LNSLIIFFKNNIFGFLLVSFITVASSFASSYIQIGSIACAIIIGMVVKSLLTIPDSFNSGINFSEKKLLSLAIIFMGVNLDIAVLDIIEWNIISLIFLLIVSTIIISIILGKIFNLSFSLSLLLGIGNGICGSSAIAGAAKVINPKDEDIGLSISTINVLGAIGIFFVPACIDLLFDLTVENKGVIIGSTIQAVGQVTAAGFIIGDRVGEIAILVKMVRILMLGPILILLSFIYIKKNRVKAQFSLPLFVVGFIFISFLFNYGFIPSYLVTILSLISKYALLFAMAGIGLKISLKSFFKKGIKVFSVGMLSFCIQILLAVYLLT
tara:strand:+ start:12 stop:986 length:975 start_codon:yes stop_codon:yes gene_type:complete